MSDEPTPGPAISAQERAQWAAVYEKAQRVAPGVWALLAGPPHVIYHYPTDNIASGRPLPSHLWVYAAQVAAVNALPRLLTALTTAEGARSRADKEASDARTELMADMRPLIQQIKLRDVEIARLTAERDAALADRDNAHARADRTEAIERREAECRLERIRESWAMDANSLRAERDAAREELRVTDELLKERTRVLEACPPCPVHGPCVPYALDWIRAQRGRPALTDLAALYRAEGDGVQLPRPDGDAPTQLGLLP